ncbi:GNAT family N-acetyltransferase [Paenibacillus herberti]|uniref:GNAT family N-acetyltransferase n=1 Tax=Paenibacillus herberti TaxID=1619309 RepID=A0A229P467_9BACL|nr:GNAT family N-acetyltransferase [Paenibacillus herberti]OXM16867.1 GNAT family N-acetyltransferase [Paenibacillus herberti]
MIKDAHVLQEEDAALAEQAEIQAMVDRLQAVKERPGNPEGVEIERAGSATALYSTGMPWPQFNCVKGVQETIVSELDHLKAFYRERGRPVRLELNPHQATEGLLTELGRRCYKLIGHHAGMYKRFGPVGNKGIDGTNSERNEGASTRPYHFPGELTIRKASREDADVYARIHCLSTGLGEKGITPVRTNNEMLMDCPDWSYWIGELSGNPVSVGVMHMKDELANLTFAGTLPEFRGRGFQQALIQARLNEAEAQGCSLAASQCVPYSGSMRNMQRVGMNLAFIRSILLLPVD